MTMTKLWVDDLRPAPEGWIWAKNSNKAISALIAFSSIDTISFDHDLGGDDTTRRVVMWLCENGWGSIKTVYVHTANPVGREWLEGTINRYGPGVTR